MKNLLKFEGVKILSKEEQQNVNGGFIYITIYCNDGYGTSFVADYESGVDNITGMNEILYCQGRGGHDRTVIGQVF